MHEIELWVKLDAEGNWAVGDAQDTCAEKYSEDYSDDGTPTRMIRVTLNVPLPKAVEVSVTVPDQPNDATATVA